MALLRQQARPMHTHHFKGGFLFEEEMLALNPSREMLVETSQTEIEPSVVGICSTKKRGRVDDHPFKSKRQRRKGCISWETTTSHPDHDGYQWRKYGEKKIMNNQHTRCYYKCTYNKEHNCKATKQVQQQDYSDPAIYNVTYFYNHVCQSTSNNVPIPCSSSNSQQILDFSAKTSPPTLAPQFVQEHRIKEENKSRERSPAASTSTVKESVYGTEEASLSQSIDSTVKTSEEDLYLFSDQLIDFYEFNSMFYGLEDSEFFSSLFETYGVL